MSHLQQLRPYQQQAFDTITRLAREKQFLLLQAATGAGKTVIAAHLMQYYTQNWRFRCLFLAHKAILVRQALTRMQASFEDADFDVDCLCASVQKPGIATGHIVVASPQTLARRLDDLPRVDMVIIDECHRVPPKGQSSLYADVIGAVIAKRPNARIVGITATPWRLGMPYIYGPSPKPGIATWWDDLDVHISIAELQQQGFLAPLAALSCAPQDDLAGIPVGASGDFREDALEATLLKPLHLGSAVQAIQDHAADRRHIAAFCVTIAHARALADRFCLAGIRARAIDSKAGPEANREALEAFVQGDIRVLCSVGMLTEGWDAPPTDCLLMCRPTLSPALYVQMVGRGLRIAEGKKDCLLLDLSGNIFRHGSPNAPRIRLRSSDLLDVIPVACGEKQGEQERHCPFCDGLLPQESGLRCPHCAAPFFEFEEQKKSFQSIDLARLERYVRRGEEVRRLREEALHRQKEQERADLEEKARVKARIKATIVNQGQPALAKVVSASPLENHQVRNGPCAGVQTLKVELLVEIPGYGRRTILQILDPEGAMGRKNRSFFWVLQDTRSFWDRCGQGTMPTSKAGLLARWHTVRLPAEVIVRESGSRWLRILWKQDKLPA